MLLKTNGLKMLAKVLTTLKEDEDARWTKFIIRS